MKAERPIVPYISPLGMYVSGTGLVLPYPVSPTTIEKTVRFWYTESLEWVGGLPEELGTDPTMVGSPP